MSEDESKKKLDLGSLPPEVEEVDASWDDDTVTGGDRPSTIETVQPVADDPFDRVTAIPSVPPDEFAARTMASADQNRDSDPGQQRRVAPNPKRPPVVVSAHSPPMDIGVLAPTGPRRARTVVGLAPQARFPATSADDTIPPQAGLRPPNQPDLRAPKRLSPPPSAPPAGPTTPPPPSLSPEIEVSSEEQDYDEGEVTFSEAEVTEPPPPLEEYEVPEPAEPATRDDFAVTSDPFPESVAPRSYDGPSLELEPYSDRGSALDLAEQKLARDSVPEIVIDPLRDMKDRYATGDFTGALAIAEELLEKEPDNADAKRYSESCREVLTKMYTARLSPLSQVPNIAVPPEQIRWLSLDHRAGFVLSLVDGASSVEEILDISGMPRLDALRIVHGLLEQRVIALS